MVIKDFIIYGNKITMFEYDRKPVWIAKDVGFALGYASSGNSLVGSIGDARSTPYIEGRDYINITYENLRSLKIISSEMQLRQNDFVQIHPKTQKLMFLTIYGLNKLCAKGTRNTDEVLRFLTENNILIREQLIDREMPKMEPNLQRTNRPSSEVIKDKARLLIDLGFDKDMIQEVLVEELHKTGIMDIRDIFAKHKNKLLT